MSDAAAPAALFGCSVFNSQPHVIAHSEDESSTTCRLVSKDWNDLVSRSISCSHHLKDLLTVEGPSYSTRHLPQLEPFDFDKT